MDENVKKKSRELAMKVVRIHKHLTAVKKETVMSEELLRCGAGAGSELVKTDFAMGANDQMAKIYKALQDCVEAKYWLELLYDTEYITEFEFNDTSKCSDELGKSIVALLKNFKAKMAGKAKEV